MSATAAATPSGRPAPVEVGVRPQDPTSVKILAFAVVLIDVVLVGVGLLTQRTAHEVGWDIVVWLLLVGLTSFAPIYSGNGTVLAMDLPLLLASAIVFGPGVSGLLALACAFDIRGIHKEISVLRTLYNHAQISLSVMAAALVFRAIGGSIDAWPWAGLAGLLALLADCLVNYTLVALVVSLSGKRRFLGEVAKLRFGPPAVFVPAYAAFGFGGVFLAQAYASLGVWGLAALVVPVILARQAFAHRQDLEVANEVLEARRKALSDVDERIAEERRDERARIAESLHDDVLQSLYNVTIRTQVIREDLRSGRLLELDGDVPSLLAASDRAVEELRETIQGLRRSPIGRAGLVDTLELLVDHLRDESGKRFVVHLEEVRASPSSMLLVYQIAREALTNAVRHSKGSVVWLRLAMDGEAIVLVVEDDGRGFDEVSSSGSRHFGLALMRERALAGGGELKVISQPGSGTTIVATLPAR